ncbi:MAG: efflux RND transporter periplasmic adaptor subunit [Planctomycetota bacterium]
MERCIDELAELARHELPPGRFFAEVLRRAIQPGGASRVVLWRMSMDEGWESAGAMPESNSVDASMVAERQALLAEVAAETQPRVISGTNANGDVLILSPLRHAGDAVGILETVHPLPVGGSLSISTYQFLAAMCEITADFLSQQELQQLRRAKVLWQQFDHYQQRLGQAFDIASVSAAIANDGRLIVACDRITVLLRDGHRYQVAAITGVDRPDPRAGGVRLLELLGSAMCSGGVYWSTGEALADPVRRDAVEQYQRESGAVALGVIPVQTHRVQTSNVPDVIFVFESFQLDEKWNESRSRAESLAHRSLFALRAAIEQSEIPGLGLLRQVQKLPRILRRKRVLVLIPAILAIVFALVLIPAEFTVTGQGELWPDERREVFATTTGIVDKILVEHGSEVTANQPLILLRDPELEQDVPKIMGEIATKAERLRGVQIARLTGQGSPEAARVRQLASDEEELKEQLKSLELQRALIEERRQALTIRSPIAGRVLTWDVDQHLLARPVERGQSLLMIGETAGEWVLEIQVIDKDAGHLLRARSAIAPDLDVEFQLPSESGRIHRGKIRDVALVSESDDRTVGRVRVVVAFDRQQIEQLRPGATAIPRIRCGKKSLGYVWLHDLIDAIWIRLLF